MSDAEISDAAKRMSDAVNLAALNGATGRWLSFKLSDGSTDHTLYDSRFDAVAHTVWPEYSCFVQVAPGGMQPRDAETVLGYWRRLNDSGYRDTDPSFKMPMMPLTKKDSMRQIKIITKRKS